MTAAGRRTRMPAGVARSVCDGNVMGWEKLVGQFGGFLGALGVFQFRIGGDRLEGFVGECLIAHFLERFIGLPTGFGADFRGAFVGGENAVVGSVGFFEQLRLGICRRLFPPVRGRSCPSGRAPCRRTRRGRSCRRRWRERVSRLRRICPARPTPRVCRWSFP